MLGNMVVKPKIRGFVCITSHPDGCAAHVKAQIDVVQSRGPIANAPKKVLVLGASTGYGLASRITAAFGGDADTLGVFYERPSTNGRPASAGWYNSVAFEQAAKAEGRYAKSINGDAFSDAMRQQVIETIRADLGQVDCVIYSLAAPRRTDPVSGDVYKSALKPIGEPFIGKHLNTDKKQIESVEIEPATEADITGTVKVMGGEDWSLWLYALRDAGVLADGATAIAYSYIGPEVTYPIYYNGTIGEAKKHLDSTAAALRESGFNAYVSVNKAVVTQSSSAIPVVPLYISILLKVMKEKGLHEDCIEQIDRLFREKLYHGGPPVLDDEQRLRVDDWEMQADIQNAVMELWPDVSTENLETMTDFAGYQEAFLKLFGFGLPGVDYDRETELERDLS